MKKIATTALIITLTGFAAGCGSKQEASAPAEAAREQAAVAAADEDMQVELGCAMCIYEQDGIDRCTTAARIGDTVLLVDSDLDAHKAGLCSAAKNATVMAHVDGDRLVVSRYDME